MIDTREAKFDTNPNLLCETFSTENFKLRQVETDTVYGSSVIDIIEGYHEYGKPYSRFTYVETDITDIDHEFDGGDTND